MTFKNCVLGIELGSTRIKAVLLDENHSPIASGSCEWENRLENGIWTYALEDVHTSLQQCYAELKNDVFQKFGTVLKETGAVGISGMMHGYLPFDNAGRLLCPFRTWRNTITEQASDILTDLLGVHIPQRWSIAHLYQAILNDEPHLYDLAHLTTLAGYIHWKLTGEKVLGIGEASGMFPIDSALLDYNPKMLEKTEHLIAEKKYPWTLKEILPTVLPAGVQAGVLTAEGAAFLDPAGDLKPGIPMAPPEGDAGTGMTAVNSVAVRTGNVSAGTSIFAMVVTEKELGLHKEIDMVTTPAGRPVAMVHCNNCTSDINAWVYLFEEFAKAAGFGLDKGKLFSVLFGKALEGDADCGGLLSYNYLSGEHITNMFEGRPVFVRKENASMNLANFMRTHLYSALASLRIGLDILTQEENVSIESLCGHGGFFKVPGVGQRFLSAAVQAPVTVMESAGEGGPYGMALLTSYMLTKGEDESLEDFLANRIFASVPKITLMADETDIQGFNTFLDRYKAGLAIERTAIQTI